MKKHLRFSLLAVLFVAASFGHFANAQSSTAGDIAGTVADPTGAAIPGASITVTNVGTGQVKTATSGTSGAYRVSLLAPGAYKISVSAPGFSTEVGTVNVAAGAVTSDELKLAVGQSSTTVEVTAAPAIVNVENGDVTTVFTAEEVLAQPNPGNDLTFVAQTAPGTVMNTGGTAGSGYGNFSSFGISGLSNMFTLDGGYENDPFLNLNNTGASNLTLGNNEVDSVTVTAPAFSAQYGGLGGAQVTENTVAGSNRLHGQLQYFWSGRVLNANDWFNKQSEAYTYQQDTAAGIPHGPQDQNIPAFVNANQYAASVGGPIIKDRLFFYVNTEGIRVTTPVEGQVYAPSPAYQACALTGTGCAALSAAGLASNAGVGPFTQAPASQVPLLTKIFNTYNTSPYRPATVTADANDPTAVTYFAHAASLLTEWLLTARLDYHISDKDNIYIHYKQDHGTQPTYVDLVSPLFSAFSPQPAWEGQINETHNFTNNFVNQLVIAGNYYSAPFQNTNNFLPVAPVTVDFIDGDLQNTAYGGINYDFPQGRRVAGYQVIDDVSYTKGRSTVTFGYNFRRDNVTDLPQVLSQATLSYSSVEAFANGQSGYEYLQRFPKRLEEPIAVYNQGGYVQESYKVMPNLTFIAGLRLEHNSDPTCLANCEQTLSYPIAGLPTGATSTTTPYNAAYPGGYILAGRHRAFQHFQKAGIMPRVSFNWQPFGKTSKTVVRGGFGMFTDSPPGQIADTLLSNAPGVFRGLVYGSDAGYPTVYLDPTTAGSAGAIATASNVAFQNAFTTGGSYTTTRAAVAATGGIYSAPSFTTAAPQIKYPTYEEYSLAIEQQIGAKNSVAITYVGNHGYHEPISNGGFNLASTGSTKAGIAPGFFPTVPTARPNTAFNILTNIYTGASSNFNGVVLSATRRTRDLSVKFNYEFSHALDESSNGGLEPFGGGNGDSAGTENPNNIHSQYGNADYNVKHNVTASFVYEVPVYKPLEKFTGGLEIAGNVFHESGLPYTVLQSTTNLGYSNAAGAQLGTTSFTGGSVLLYARQLNNNFDHHCGGGAHVINPAGTVNSPCNFVNSFGAPTNFAQQSRNSLTGPSFTQTDISALKTFSIPFASFMKLKVGAQMFNLFNHPNFDHPASTLTGTPNSAYGGIASTVAEPTSIFGSTGASSSPRIVQLKGVLIF